MAIDAAFLSPQFVATLIRNRPSDIDGLPSQDTERVFAIKSDEGDEGLGCVSKKGTEYGFGKYRISPNIASHAPFLNRLRVERADLRRRCSYSEAPVLRERHDLCSETEELIAIVYDASYAFS